MRNRKMKEAGLMGGGGVNIDGDIHLKLGSLHSSESFFLLRIIIAFAAAFSTVMLANEFTDSDIRVDLIIYNCLVAVGSIGLIFSKHKIVKICSGVVLLIYLSSIVCNLKLIGYGFLVAANRYLTKGDLPEQTTGMFKHILTDKTQIEQALYYFFLTLILVEALGAVLSCVARIDFPMLFLFTFPVLEIGLYLGFDVPLYAVLLLLVAWITVLSLNIINHTTNKAGRRNTFAVHERTKTFYFTSNEAKSEFYTSYIRFVSLLTAAVFLTIVLFSKITGFYRPDSFTDMRYNLHHAMERFDLTHADDFFIDANGGSDLMGVTTVGGTNGGDLGNSEGISFNGSTALLVDTEAFNYTMYLRGYVAGSYKDNKWSPAEEDEDMKAIKDAYKKTGYCPQDIDWLILMGGIEDPSSHTARMGITVRGACSKFAYAPYGSVYSGSPELADTSSGMMPYGDSYVRVSQSLNKYKLVYRNFDNTSWLSRIQDISWYADGTSFSALPASSEYSKYVKDNYLECADVEALDKVYKTISESYLDGRPELYSYQEIYMAIKQYFYDRDFTYNTTPGATPEGRDFIDYFLTEQKSGYCTYYATVGAQLLRKFGFPTRYVEGYMILPTQLNGSETEDGRYEIKVKDKCAHAWAEVFIDGVGWMPAEFTPGYQGDNPNLSDDEKGIKKEVEDTESSSLAESSSSEAEESEADTSKANSEADTSSELSDSSEEQSASDSTAQGGGTNSNADTSSQSRGTGTGTGQGPAAPPEQKAESSSPFTKTIAATAIAIVLGAAAVVINRRRCLRRMEEQCAQQDLNRRVVSIYRYSLKYLELINIEIKKNISDMQMCDEIIKKCHEQRIHSLDDKMDKLAEIAVKAQLSPDRITKEEADEAELIMKCISEKVVAKRLTRFGMLSAKYLYCLY